MITSEMRTLIERNTIGLVATVTPDGEPAVSPKGTTVVVDASIIVSSTRMSGFVRSNPCSAEQVRTRAVWSPAGRHPARSLGPALKWRMGANSVALPIRFVQIGSVSGPDINPITRFAAFPIPASAGPGKLKS